jgi:toxin ParE1/3/4
VKRPFRTEPEASAELEEAAVWYASRRPGLGVEFLEAVDATLDRIARWPRAARRVPGVIADVPARKAPVKGFPLSRRISGDAGHHQDSRIRP